MAQMALKQSMVHATHTERKRQNQAPRKQKAFPLDLCQAN